jgi:hypothetical protein
VGTRVSGVQCSGVQCMPFDSLCASICIAKRLCPLLSSPACRWLVVVGRTELELGACCMRSFAASALFVLPSARPRLISGTRLPWSEVSPAEGPMVLRHRLSSTLPFREAVGGSRVHQRARSESPDRTPIIGHSRSKVECGLGKNLRDSCKSRCSNDLWSEVIYWKCRSRVAGWPPLRHRNQRLAAVAVELLAAVQER